MARIFHKIFGFHYLPLHLIYSCPLQNEIHFLQYCISSYETLNDSFVTEHLILKLNIKCYILMPLAYIKGINIIFLIFYFQNNSLNRFSAWNTRAHNTQKIMLFWLVNFHLNVSKTYLYILNKIYPHMQYPDRRNAICIV